MAQGRGPVPPVTTPWFCTITPAAPAPPAGLCLGQTEGGRDAKSNGKMFFRHSTASVRDAFKGAQWAAGVQADAGGLGYAATPPAATATAAVGEDAAVEGGGELADLALLLMER